MRSSRESVSSMTNCTSFCSPAISCLLYTSIGALEALPRTASGKTDLKALENGRTAGAPAAASRGDGELTALWEKALGGPVDPMKSFFEQGGTSLSALNLLGQYFNRHWTLTLEQFYDHPTLAEQAALLLSLIHI